MKKKMIFVLLMSFVSLSVFAKNAKEKCEESGGIWQEHSSGNGSYGCYRIVKSGSSIIAKPRTSITPVSPTKAK